MLEYVLGVRRRTTHGRNKTLGGSSERSRCSYGVIEIPERASESALIKTIRAVRAQRLRDLRHRIRTASIDPRLIARVRARLASFPGALQMLVVPFQPPRATFQE